MAVRRTPFAVLAVALALGLSISTGALQANAAAGVVGASDFLGSAASLAVLGGQSVSNTGPSVISGDVGVSPGLAVTGFPPGLVNGSIYAPPAAQAVQGQTDASNAYDALEALVGTPIPNDLTGYEYGPGVYHGQPGASTLALTGTVVLNGGPDDVFVFQSSSTLITGSSSVVYLTGGARACNVFWQVGSSATLGTSSVMAGTVIARISVSATTNALVGSGADDGARLLALDGSVTLDSNVIRVPSTCVDATGGTTAGAPGTVASAPTLAAAAVFAAQATTDADASRAVAVAAAVPPPAAAAVAVASVPELAATGRDVGRPVVVASLVTLVGVMLLSGSRLRRGRPRH